MGAGFGFFLRSTLCSGPLPPQGAPRGCSPDSRSGEEVVCGGDRAGVGMGRAEPGLPAATLWPARARARSMVPRDGPDPRGPDARGRAGRRRGSPSCAARLASAILDAAAAAASASSSVFAARRWFLRAPSGGEAKQEPAGGKRKEGVERSRGPGLEGGSPRPSGAEKRRRRGPAPPPQPAAAGPPRQRLCSPARRSARPSGHAGASPPLRKSPSPPVPA